MLKIGTVSEKFGLKHIENIMKLIWDSLISHFQNNKSITPLSNSFEAIHWWEKNFKFVYSTLAEQQYSFDPSKFASNLRVSIVISETTNSYKFYILKNWLFVLFVHYWCPIKIFVSSWYLRYLFYLFLSRLAFSSHLYYLCSL